MGGSGKNQINGETGNCLIVTTTNITMGGNGARTGSYAAAWAPTRIHGGTATTWFPPGVKWSAATVVAGPATSYGTLTIPDMAGRRLGTRSAAAWATT